jgi:cellulose synthase/poly-beta-1,6-N-acetylglucosamine synthase-like glycosyltransferase
MNRHDILQTPQLRQPPASPSAATIASHLNVGTMPPAAAPGLSVVSPCYNEQESLTELWRRLTKSCTEQVGDSYEIVLVDDGSVDSTRSIISKLCEADAHLVGVVL